MSIQKIIQESVNKNPLGIKEAIEEELRSRIALALEAKMELDEITKTAMKKSVTYTGSDGHSHTKLVPVTRVNKDETGQDKIKTN
jgi:hypothetical protein